MQNFSLQDTGATGSQRFGNLAQRAGSALGKVPLKRWQALILLLIVIWLAHSLAQLFWAVLPTPNIPPAQVAINSATSTGNAGSQADIDIARLRELTVFGASTGGDNAAEQPEISQPLEPQIEDQAVDTKLSLVLQGVISSSDDRSARAIIADARAQEIYGPGDEIKNMRGVKVAKVLDLRVILDNKGQYESLWLYKEGPGSRAIAKRYTPPAVENNSRSWEGDDAEIIGEGGNAEAPQPGPIERDTPSAKGADDRVSVEQIGQNLSDVVAFNIHRGADGQIKGYKVRPGRNPAAFDAVGLQAGDVVTAVNGTPLDNPGRIMEIYRNLGQATSASLEIERNGDIVTVDVELE